MEWLGRLLILTGVVFIILGLGFTLMGRIGGLPGDIVIKRDSFTVFIPITSSLLISLILSLLLTIIVNLLRGR